MKSTAVRFYCCGWLFYGRRLCSIAGPPRTHIILHGFHRKCPGILVKNDAAMTPEYHLPGILLLRNFASQPNHRWRYKFELSPECSISAKIAIVKPLNNRWRYKSKLSPKLSISCSIMDSYLASWTALLLRAVTRIFYFFKIIKLLNDRGRYAITFSPEHSISITNRMITDDAKMELSIEFSIAPKVAISILLNNRWRYELRTLTRTFYNVQY